MWSFWISLKQTMTWNTAREPKRITAEGTALELHQRYAITEPREIDVVRIAMARGVYVADGSTPGTDAWLARGKTLGLVRVSNAIRERGRRRFAIAHELGHWELHAKENQLGALCKEADLRDYRNSPLEAEANIFAAEFLMPRKLFLVACARRKPSLALIKDLAEHFGTSLTATAMRYVELAPETCLVTFSEGGRMRFWRSQRESEYWLPKGHSTPQESQAWQCWMNGLDESPPVELPGEVWFNHLRGGADELSVVEESMRLGGYNQILSLLWIS